VWIKVLSALVKKLGANHIATLLFFRLQLIAEEV